MQTPFVQDAISNLEIDEGSLRLGWIDYVNRDKWDRRFMEVAKLVSGWSKDPSTKIGAVAVNDQNVVVGMGYNGFPRGVEDSEYRLNNRDLKYKLVVHGEVNALLEAVKTGVDMSKVRLYVYPTLMLPNICPECAKVAAQLGVGEVIGYLGETTERWQQHAEASSIILQESGIKLRVIRP